MRARHADFFLCSGDNVYADGPVVESVPLPDGSTWRNLMTPAKSKVAETLDEFRGQYQYNLMADNWRAFLAETAQVSQWDDHEVTNNWYPGEILDDARYAEKRVDVLAARARQAFHEYVPVAAISPDPEGRVYRVIHYGPLLDLFVLDMRTHKDPNTTNRETTDDGGVLGERQTRWLLEELGRSRATWKVIAADLPIGLIVPDGTAAQEGIAQGDAGAPLGRERGLARVLTGAQAARHPQPRLADRRCALHGGPPLLPRPRGVPGLRPVLGVRLRTAERGSLRAQHARGHLRPGRGLRGGAARTQHLTRGRLPVLRRGRDRCRSKRLSVTLRDVDGAGIYTQTLDPHRR